MQTNLLKVKKRKKKKGMIRVFLFLGAARLDEKF